MTDTPTEREAESIWTSLRRRKVVQWGLAYGAGAWLLLQVLGFAADAFAWPVITKQLAMLGLAVGLPIVVALAWYHGDRGQQRVTGPELAVLTLLLLLGGGLLWVYAQRSAPTTTTTTVKPAPTSADADTRPSIAVLPFENRSDVQKDAFFVDGIHDDILTQLTKVGALKVIARTSVEQFRDTKLPTREIGEKLGVTKVLEGGVQRAGDRVRVTVQLIDAASDAHLWAESYDRELTAANIFAIQSEIATTIAGALRATLTPVERAQASVVPTRSLEAWEAYQLGKQRTAKRTSADLMDAERFFRKALQVDANFALAYAGLADALVLQIDYTDVPVAPTLAKADEIIATALELDPQLGEAWASAGLVAAAREQFGRAEHSYRRAIELRPNYAPAHYWLSQLLRALGRLNESIAEGERAVELDPLSGKANESLGGALGAAGRFLEAEARLRKAIQIDPARPAPYVLLGYMKAYAQNRFAEGVPLVRMAAELDSGDPSRIADLARLYFDLGEHGEADRLLTLALDRWPDNTRVLETAASAKLQQLDLAAARRHAVKTLELVPRNYMAVTTLSIVDRQKRDYAAARARYAKAYPELLGPDGPRVDGSNYWIAIDLAEILQTTNERKRAGALLDRTEEVVRRLPRLGLAGYLVADVQIYALRGDRVNALAALRDATKAGWRFSWLYFRDIDPTLASIRNEPEFKAIFADIERDMARQRAELAARPTDAPLELKATGT